MMFVMSPPIARLSFSPPPSRALERATPPKMMPRSARTGARKASIGPKKGTIEKRMPPSMQRKERTPRVIEPMPMRGETVAHLGGRNNGRLQLGTRFSWG